MMIDRPILFSAPMVRALLAGTKTQTRRLVKPQPVFAQVHEWNGRPVWDAESRAWCWRDVVLPDGLWDFPNGEARQELAKRCPYGVPGDRLWVRETWGTATGNGHRTVYRADVGTDRWPPTVDAPTNGAWRPSIHMPRWASRLTLEVTSLRVERLHEITEEDARAEGVEAVSGRWRNYQPEHEASGIGTAATARHSFQTLWASINGDESLAANPWLWVVSFKRVTL